MSSPEQKPENRHGRLLVIVVCILALAATVWRQWPDDTLQLHVLAAPGDAVLIRTPAGRFVLIDGGRDPAQLALLLGRTLPFWQRDLLAVVLTEGGGRRLPGQLAALARYRPALALAPPQLGERGAAGEYRRLVVAHGLALRPLRAGQRLELDGATLVVLAVHSGDEGGAVLLLRYGVTSALIHTGGAAGDQAALAVAGRPIDLLIYPWQRQLDTPVVRALRPGAIVFSTAQEAHDHALLSYADRRRFSPRIFHPGNEGTITFTSDGRHATISAEDR